MVRIKIAGSNSLLAVLKSNFVPQTKAMFVFKQLDVDMMMLWVIFSRQAPLPFVRRQRIFFACQN